MKIIQKASGRCSQIQPKGAVVGGAKGGKKKKGGVLEGTKRVLRILLSQPSFKIFNSYGVTALFTKKKKNCRVFPYISF